MFICQFLFTSLRHKSTFPLQRQWKSTFSSVWALKKIEVGAGAWLGGFPGGLPCAAGVCSPAGTVVPREPSVSHGAGTCSCSQALQRGWCCERDVPSPGRPGRVSATPGTWDTSDRWHQDGLVGVGLGQLRDPQHRRTPALGAAPRPALPWGVQARGPSAFPLKSFTAAPSASSEVSRSFLRPWGASSPEGPWPRQTPARSRQEAGGARQDLPCSARAAPRSSHPGVLQLSGFRVSQPPPARSRAQSFRGSGFSMEEDAARASTRTMMLPVRGHRGAGVQEVTTRWHSSDSLPGPLPCPPGAVHHKNPLACEGPASVPALPAPSPLCPPAEPP